MPSIFFRSLNNAGVAELADALDSKSSVLWDVWVQVPPPAFRLGTVVEKVEKL